jgi:GNAT superfamily N-acetyltransferase
MPFVVDRLRKDELEGAMRLSTQAGWNQTPVDWIRLFDLAPDGCFAGRLDGALVATSTLASYGNRVHWIGMVLVDEACRGQGFGSKMLARTVERGRERGGTVGLDATDLGRPVYLKQGFLDVAPIDRWRGELKVRGARSDLELLDRTNFDEVVTLDHLACGADRSEFLLHLMHEPGVFGVVSRRGSVTGFGLLRPGLNWSHVGPIVATDDQTQGELLDRLAQLAEGKTVLLDALTIPATSAILERHGLAVSRRLTRMAIGSAAPVLMSDRVRAIASFEWG